MSSVSSVCSVPLVLVEKQDREISWLCPRGFPSRADGSEGRRAGLELITRGGSERAHAQLTALIPSLRLPFQMATLGEARLKEMEALRSLRAANEGKVLCSEEDAELKVCVCQKEPAAPMIQCELCRGFFHTGCVSVPHALQGPRVWLCPQCRRSEKPPLEKILPLLASLQRIRVRLPEGDALRYMIERTVNWQHRAQQMLYSGNLKLLQDKVGSGLLYNRWQSTAGPLPETNKVRLSAPGSPGCGWDVSTRVNLTPLCFLGALYLLISNPSRQRLCFALQT